MSGAVLSTSPRRPPLPAVHKGLGGRVNTFPLLAPSVVLLALFAFVPLAMTLYYSFRRFNLLNPQIHGWAGFTNYRYLLEDSSLYSAMLITIELVAAVLVISVVLGAVLAALSETNFPGRGITRVLLISPFFVMPTVSALIWKNLLMHPVNGLLAWISRSLGLPVIDFFGHFPLLGIVIIVAWQWLPFAFLILLTALQSLDEEQIEAARIDGAGPLSMFFFIQVPHMGRAIGVVVMMETIFLLSIFAEIYVTTTGGPGVATTNLAFLIYQRALLAFNVGSASAAGVIAIILANIVATFLMKSVSGSLEE
jgi:sorbitol/mannitol transport system permease protein